MESNMKLEEALTSYRQGKIISRPGCGNLCPKDQYLINCCHRIIIDKDSLLADDWYVVKKKVKKYKIVFCNKASNCLVTDYYFLDKEEFINKYPSLTFICMIPELCIEVEE